MRNKNGLLFDEIDRDLSTKDRQVICDKLELLDGMMQEFLHIEKRNTQNGSAEEFISESLGMDLEEVRCDMDFYEESLDRLEEETIKVGSRLLDIQNRRSLLAMMVYSYREDEDLDEWMIGYAASNNTYFADQRQNFLYMKADFERFLEQERKREDIV